MTVVIGVDGAGRTHRLGALAAAAATAVWVDDPTQSADRLADRLAAIAAGALVVADDVDRLPDDLVDVLVRAVGQGTRVAVSRRPTIRSRVVAALDEAVAAQGSVEVLEPLDDQALAGLIVAATGRPADPEDVRTLADLSAGLPALAVALAPSPSTAAVSPPPALVVRMQQRLARLDPASAALARVLALRLDIDDDVLAAASGLALGDLAGAMRDVRDGGMLVPGGERMIPAVALALLTDLSAVERRRLHDAVAEALVAKHADPVLAAEQLAAARVRTPPAAAVYAAAADRLRFTEPATSAGWYERALDAGVDPTAAAPGRAEVAALLGRPVDTDALPPTADAAARIVLAAGAAAAHAGRLERAGQALLAASHPGPALAVPALVGTGQLNEARRVMAGHAPEVVDRFAAAVLDIAEPEAALPRLIEVAEDTDRSAPDLVLPDTPHAIGAVVAVLVGDAATAEHLLDRGLETAVGGPVAVDRHRLLLAWVRLRTGRYDTAIAEVQRVTQLALPGRERLVAAALSAALARRSGDIGRLREAWALAEPALARRTVDLFALEAMEELLVAAARLHEQRRVEPVIAELAEIVEGLGGAPAWRAALAWVRLQVAVASDDVEAAEGAVTGFAATPPAPACAGAMAAGAVQWVEVLCERVDAEAVLAAADGLVAAELPWEASRLVGQAAIRVPEPKIARRLLERARELATSDPDVGDGRADGRADGDRSGLTDREVEVAELVVAGRTYKEIGAQLYLSPKTIEHHVARIRTKLGATSRAELLAALRSVLDPQG